eukprot:CAMPEP_0118898852 /NCGR_PEP_ID=MMETSP1166-20130328/5673_1 /TAXON_ID=1104430 /ORGANISM="Chrysoreinhardia sp, Strain CCMP3193" /LENGTH=101 /DNA_ID=CAMNT_0006837971 /DNA_START=126 /DNA_END=429 /DNA_ORIENTATION=-
MKVGRLAEVDVDLRPRRATPKADTETALTDGTAVPDGDMNELQGGRQDHPPGAASYSRSMPPPFGGRDVAGEHSLPPDPRPARSERSVGRAEREEVLEESE